MPNRSGGTWRTIIQRSDLLRAWGRILRGYKPALSIEITKECPLSCPGCYAYNETHLRHGPLRRLSDLKGRELVDGILTLVKRYRPLHVSLVGGEPLVRFRELNILLPQLCAMGIPVQLVTSAVRPIPQEWANLGDKLRIMVSIDGLQPEHDGRRKPATYDRILKHIEGHQIGVHCTITSQMMCRQGYLAEFVRFWSARPETRLIWMSIFTPQKGVTSVEILTAEMRRGVAEQLNELREHYPKLQAPQSILQAYLNPPSAPERCIFARTTRCFSADLKTRVEPCQFGGNPDCSQCGCAASAGLHSLGQHRLLGSLKVEAIFEASLRIGNVVQRLAHFEQTEHSPQ